MGTLSVPQDLDELLSDSQYQDEAGEANLDGDTKALISNEDLDSISELHKTQRFIDLMQKVEDSLQIGSSDHGDHGAEYQLILDCNTILRDIEIEIASN